MERRSLVPGLFLITIGAIILAANLSWFSILDFWPLLVILTGLFFFALWLRERENYGLLMPAAVVTIIGFLFLYCQGNGWWYMSDLWPIFIIAPGIGFFLMYIFGEQEGGLLVPGSILLVIGTLFLSIHDWSGWWWPILLILIGAVLLFRPPKKPERVLDDFNDPGTEPPVQET